MFYILGFFYTVFEIWCAFYTYSTPPFEPTTFQGPNRNMWLVATEMDTIAFNQETFHCIKPDNGPDPCEEQEQ